jgi:hypothetical protein
MIVTSTITNKSSAIKNTKGAQDVAFLDKKIPWGLSRK